MSAFDGVHGTVCDATQYDLSKSANANITCLTPGETIGLALTAMASFLSCIAVVVILVRIVRNFRWYRKTFPFGHWRLFQGPTDIYMLALFVFDALQAMGGILDVRWAHNGIVTTGHYCTAQGTIQQIGELGVALVTLLLAVNSLLGALWEQGLEARGVAFGLVCLTCVFIALWVGIGAGHLKNYEAPTPYWCWISTHYSSERFAGEYLWLWMALFASVLVSIPLYFWAEGRLSIPKGRWWWPDFHKPKFDQTVEYLKRRTALAMIVYPLSYALIVLPVTISRWLEFRGHNVSSAATFFGVIMFNLSGAINVLLFLIFKPQLLLFPRPDELAHPIELETAKSEHSSEPTTAGLADEGAGTSGRISDEGI